MRSWSREYELVPRSRLARFEERDAAFRPSEPAAVSAFLARLADAAGMQALRLALADEAPGIDLRQMEDAEVIEQISRRIVQQRLVILRSKDEPVAPPNIEGAPPSEKPAPKEALASIRIVVVEDRTYKPIGGITLTVTLSGGREAIGTTGADGSIEHWNIPPGRWDLRSSIDGASLASSFEIVQLDDGEPPPPLDDKPIEGAGGRRFAAVIHRHRVSHRDSLDSVARSFKLTWQQLAEFNFGTSSPREINRHLHDDVGCRERTEDGKNYVFDDHDDPGLLYVPAPWARRDLATDRTYTLRLRVPMIAKPRKKMFLFSI